MVVDSVDLVCCVGGAKPSCERRDRYKLMGHIRPSGFALTATAHAEGVMGALRNAASVGAYACACQRGLAFTSARRADVLSLFTSTPALMWPRAPPAPCAQPAPEHYHS